MKLKIATVLTLALPGCQTTPPPSATVLRCFCQQLDTQRKAEAQESAHLTLSPDAKDGVPTTVWPDINKADACIQAALSLNPDDADGALQQERRTGALQGDDGVALCAAAGYQVDETAPEPASPAIMQAAREYNCRMLAVPLPPTFPPDPSSPMNDKQFDQYAARMKAASDAEEAREAADFAAQHGISKETADAAINRAAADHEARKFTCPEN